MTKDVKEHYPHLSSYLELKGMPLKAAYTVLEVGTMFEVNVRTIQTWIFMRRLNQRNVPGRAKIFPADLEALLAASEKPPTSHSDPGAQNPRQEVLNATRPMAKLPKRRDRS
jgi:hypothetical protein